MPVNRLVTKIDGVVVSDDPFQATIPALPAGAHTITVEAYNGSTLVDSQTRNVVVSSAATYEPETTAFMTATSTPDNGSASIYSGKSNHDCWMLLDSVIKYYKAQGVWSDIEHWHPMFGDTTAKLAFNAKDISKFQVTFFGSWAFDAAGCKGNGTNTYAKFGFIPANEMSFEDSGLSIVCLSHSSSGTCLELGSASGTDNRTYIQALALNVGYIRIGASGAVGQFSNSDAIGIYTGTRYNGTIKAYKNLLEKSSGTGAGNGLSSIESFYGAYNNEGTTTLFSDRRLGSMMHHKSTNVVIIQQGLKMWEEGLGRITI